MDDQRLDVNEILDNEVVISGDESTDIKENETSEVNAKSYTENEQHSEEYVVIYSGKAMTERELLSFSARNNNVSLIMVAGAYASGKTTLMVMMYRLFLEGKNKTLHFKSSNTMKGYWERGYNLMQNSGRETPVVERTPSAATDLFLNLNVLDEDQHNLVFADLSGEIFETSDLADSALECFINSKIVWLVLDGEKMGHADMRRATFQEFSIMIENLIHHGYISNSTKLLLICTKMDSVTDKDSKAYIDEKLDFLKAKYEKLVDEIKIWKVSARNIDDEKQSDTLEQIMMESFSNKCSDIQMEDIITDNRGALHRAFEYYGLRK